MCQDTAVNKCPCPLCSYFVGGHGKYISKRVRSKLRRKKKKRQRKEDNDISEVSKDFSDKVASPLNLRMRKAVMQVSGERSEKSKDSEWNVLA